MPKYQILFDATLTVEIEASTEDEAIKEAKNIAEQENDRLVKSDSSLSICYWQNFLVEGPDGIGYH